MKTHILTSVKKIKLHKVSAALYALFRTVLIIGLGFMILYPVLTKVSTSFKSYADFYDPTVFFIPKNPTLDHFKLAIESSNYFGVLLSTIGITALISFLQVASCTVTAYGLARFKFPGKKLVMAMVVLTLVVPPQTILMPLYLKFLFFNPLELFKLSGFFTGIQLTDSIIPFLLLSVTANGLKNGLYIYLLRQYFINSPYVLTEAAYIDGCGRFTTFLRISLPGAMGMIMTVFLFSFVWQWNDYFYTSVLAPNLPVLSNTLMNMRFSSVNEVTSNALNNMLNAPKFLLLIIPLIILYVFTQRFFTESVERSGIVG